uniref:Uncharacterized protein n=1 Tax=Rhizophora mucronata TaxID=61149 RepID=A0A2P2PDT7_RHIMU
MSGYMRIWVTYCFHAYTKKFLIST